MHYRSAAGLLVIALVGSCETACGCSPIPLASASIAGTVYDVGGAPVANPIVGLVLDESCTRASWSQDPTSGASDGMYTLSVAADRFTPVVFCFDVFAVAPGQLADTAWSLDHSIAIDTSPGAAQIDLSFQP